MGQSPLLAEYLRGEEFGFRSLRVRLVLRHVARNSMTEGFALSFGPSYEAFELTDPLSVCRRVFRVLFGSEWGIAGVRVVLGLTHNVFVGFEYGKALCKIRNELDLSRREKVL